MGEPLQGNPKDSNAGTMKKETEGKDEGPMKEDQPVKASDAPEPVKGNKGLKSSRWDKQPTSSEINIKEA